jgi:putative transcriptional regulator
MAEIVTNKLRRWRFERDEMTQEELARRADLSRQTIIAIEKGKYVPSLRVAFRLAHVLQVKLEELFQYHPEENLNPGESQAPGQ